MPYTDFYATHNEAAPNGVYATFQRSGDGLYFRPATGAFEAFVAANLASYKVALTDRGGDDWAVVTAPASDLPAGTYRVRYYAQAGAAPDVADTPIVSEEVTWTGVAVVAPVLPTPTGVHARPAGWYVSEQPTALLDPAAVAKWLRIDNPTADELAQLADAIAAAVDYAEDRISGCLMARQITATFYEGETLRLPRTPLLALQSVTDADGVAFTSDDLRVTHVGHAATVLIDAAYAYPVTIVYRAGHETPAEVPASIRQAVKAHVASLWEHRESVAKGLQPVPHSLDAFYRLKGRTAAGVA